jgi:maleylpyruvate isomerase
VFDLQRIVDAHAALVAHLEAMAGGPGAEAGAPSLLPGWTRGHVLTHIARNAESLQRLLEGAELGLSVYQYPGGSQQRDNDIAAGAGRPWDEMVDDVRLTAATFEAACRRHTRWDGAGVGGRGQPAPVADVPFRRWREVLVHHTDLGDDAYTPEQWPPEYVREELERQTMTWNARTPMGTAGLPSEALAVPELTRLLWLMGRRDIEGLEPAGIF